MKALRARRPGSAGRRIVLRLGGREDMLVHDEETRALLRQLALYLAGEGTAERALGGVA